MGKGSGDIEQIARTAVIVGNAVKGDYVVRLLPREDPALLTGTNGRRFREGDTVNVYVKDIKFNRLTVGLAPSDNGKHYRAKKPKKD